MSDAFLLIDVDSDHNAGYDRYGRLTARWHTDADGLLHGRSTTWSDNNHRMVSSKQWRHGVLHGDTEYYDEDGRRYLKIVFRDGQPVTLTYYCVHSQEAIFSDGVPADGSTRGRLKWWGANFIPRGMVTPRAGLYGVGPVASC